MNPNQTPLAISHNDVLQAAQRIAGVAHRTPVLTSRFINQHVGAQLFFKCENFQRVGAFKFRGAYNSLAQFTPEQRAKGVVAFSSGNHAQGIALSAQLLNMRAVIVMPHDAPAVKIAATRGYGAEVVLFDRYTQDREVICRELAEAQGLTLIPSYDHPHVMAGQGTCAQELFEDVGELDALLVPVGGGGLSSGCATVAAALHPNCTVIGVEPEAGNDAQRSLASGQIIHIDTPQTIADGAQTQHLGQYVFPILQRHMDKIVTVTDAEIVNTMQLFASRMKMIVEPTGCLGMAAVLSHAAEFKDKKVGVILTGGNIDLMRFAELIQGTAA